MKFSELVKDKSYLDNFKSRNLVPLTCDNCETEFQQPKNYIQGNLKKNNKTMCCSKECSNKINQVRINCECAECKTHLVRTPSEILTNTFCSQSCSAKFNNKLKTKLKTCPNCENQHKNKTYCSRTCASEHRRKVVKQQTLTGNFAGGPKTWKRILLDLFGHRCSKCELTT